MKTPKEQLPLDAFLRKYAEDRAAISKRGEDFRTQNTVALTRRFRGTSLSDRIGWFVPGGTGAWRGDIADDLEGLEFKTINITKPTIKNNMSALSSARVQVKTEAANKQPRLKGAANVAEGIVKYLDEAEQHWSGTLESRINQLSQLGYGYFVRSKHNPKKKAEYVETQDWQDQQESMPGEYACGCGAGGPFDHEMNEDDEPLDQINCPKCGQQAEVTKAPELANIPRPGPSEQFNPGDSETCVSSCLEHRIDERNSQSGNLRGANWFEHHYLVTEEELDVEFPGFDFGQSGDWCYALKWKWALETGEDVFATSNYQSEDYRKRFERRDIYLMPAEYESRVEPVACVIKDGQGNVVLSVEAGDRLCEKFTNGFCYSMVGDKIAPKFREVCFWDEWSYGCYMPDANSFWGQPVVELLQIQDDWNNLYTIQNQHLERNSINQITYNSLVYGPDDWEQDLVPTQEGWTQPDNVSLDHYFKQIQALPLTGVTQGLEFLFKILPYTGGAPPEAIGMNPPGPDTYHAQLLRKQSTLGQLQPPGESKANCKVSYMRNHFKIAQENWPEERFEYLRTRFGEEWKPDDIEAFLNCNLERDVVTTFVAGSEVPTDLIQRRMDMENVISKYIEAQVPPPQEVLRAYFDLMGIDYDLGGIEADERLADARYEKIKEGLQVLGSRGVSNAPTVTMDPQTGEPVPGPSMLIQGVMSHPGLQVKPKENHQTAIDFYVARQKALLADDMPDMALLECCDEMITRHEQAMVEEAQSKSAMDVAAQAPAAAAAAAAQAGAEGGGEQVDPQAEADAQAQQQQMEAEQQAQASAQDREHASMEAEAGRQHEHSKLDKEHAHQSNLKAMEMAHKERLAIHEGARQERIAKETAKEKAKQPKAA